MEVGIRALRLDLRRYLAEVQRGVEVVVTDRGRPVARLVPTRGSSAERLSELIARGEAEPAQTNKDDWLPEPIELAPGVTISDLVAGSAVEPGVFCADRSLIQAASARGLGVIDTWT
jgi:prevent-host-death family protein